MLRDYRRAGGIADPRGIFMAGRKIDHAETWAKDYLVYRGFKAEDVVFEPNGNVPPDSVLKSRIAVEVQRLNQHWQAASGDLEPVKSSQCHCSSD